MSDSEKYKGYDRVLEVMEGLQTGYPDLRYLLVGKYDVLEKQRIDQMIRQLGLTGKVALAGFVEDAEMAAHFGLAELFIMPSEKEGFGIVFIEAMFYGIPVIAGNRDGSTDALWDGELGLLVDPENNDEIAKAISRVLQNRSDYIPDRQHLFEHFSYTWYKRKVRNCLARIASVQ
jgi:glycosyltransferase involved in cell wall biosynthesis